MSLYKDLLDRAVLEERHKQAGAAGLSFPWEHGIYKEILGGSKDSATVPSVEVPLDLPMSSAATFDDAVQTAKSAVIEVSFTAFYRSVVEKETWRVRSKLSVNEQVALVCQKFDLVLAHDYNSSVVGRTVRDLDTQDRLDVIIDSLGGRAVSTLRKRYHQALHYVLWCQDNGLKGFPLRFEYVSEYTASLPASKGSMRVTNALEIFRFLHYVLGVDVVPPCLDHPVLRGRARREALYRPPKKQARPFLASEVLTLEGFVADYSQSAIDRYGVGCLLFAIYSVARLGDLKAVEAFELDYLEGPDAFGFLETTSYSRKTRMTSNAQGFQLKLVSPIRGIGPGTWGTHFAQAAKDVRRPLTEIQLGEPLVPALDVNGEFQSRPMKSSHLVRWVRGILRSDTFTGHSAKTTVLSWLAKWGGPPDDRTTLGHHVSKDRKSMATYSRDFQAGPLRVLDRMLGDIRSKCFLPDCTRSGRFVGLGHDMEGSTGEPAKEAEPGAFSEAEWYRHAAADSCESEEPDSFQKVSFDNDDSGGIGSPASDAPAASLPELDFQPGDTEEVQGENCSGEGEANAAAPGHENDSSSASDSDSSESSSDSDSSGDENLQLAGAHHSALRPKIEGDCTLYQHSRTRTVHMLPKGSSEWKFVCGRPVTSDHKVFMSMVCTSGMRCEQCLNGRPIRDIGALNEALSSALKRPRTAAS